MFRFDTDIFLFLNAGASPDAAVAALAIFITKYLILLIPLGILSFWIAGGNRNRQTAIALVVALVIAIMASYVVGQFIFQPRPFMIGLGNTLIEHRPNSSFPSNHGLVFATSAALLFMTRHARTAWLATLTGILVAWSRIYVGVHYPLDMLGSIAIGVFSAMAALWLMARQGALLLAFAERVQKSVLGFLSIR